MKVRLGSFSLISALTLPGKVAAVGASTSPGIRRGSCLGFCHLPLFSTRFQKAPLRWIRFPPILDKRRHEKDNDDNDESMFRELYESQQNARDDAKDYEQLSFFLEKNKSREPKMRTQQQRVDRPRSSRSMPPDALVEHLLHVFSEAEDSDDIRDALQEAFRFTSVQDFDAIQANPTIRKSWKWGQPTDLTSIAKPSYGDGTQHIDGLNDVDFQTEIETDYAFLLRCDSFSFVGSPVFSESGRLCHVDVLVQKVESTIANFYDKGVRTLNVVRPFRFSLEKTGSKGTWMVYNVKRISFAFHRTRGPEDQYDTEI